MAIIVRHDAPGLGVAYAAGQAASRRRNMRYALPELMRQQRIRQQMGLGGGRQAAIAPPAGRWDDPLADNPFLDPSERRRRKSARRSRERKYNLGIAIPLDWQPVFTPQEEIDAKNKEEAEIRAEERAEEAAKRAEQRKREYDEKIAGREAEVTLIAEGETDIRKRLSTGEYSEEQRTEANAILQKIGKIKRSRILTPDDWGPTLAEVNKLEAELQAILDNPQGVDTDAMGQAVFKERWAAGLKDLPWDWSSGQPQLPGWMKVEDLSDKMRGLLDLRPLPDPDAEARETERLADLKSLETQRQKLIDNAEKLEDAWRVARMAEAKANRPRTAEAKANRPDDDLSDDEKRILREQTVVAKQRRDDAIAALQAFEKQNAAEPAATAVQSQPTTDQALAAAVSEGMAASQVSPPSEPKPRLDLDKLEPQSYTSFGPSAGEPLSAEEFEKQWQLLKPGDSLRGPDGQIYVKQR